LSEFFSQDISIIENDETDSRTIFESPGPTVVSSATLEVWRLVSELSIDELRMRFRPNLEVGGVEPFWEDRLFRDDRQLQRFPSRHSVVGRRQSLPTLVVPTRDATTGRLGIGLRTAIQQTSRTTLPLWSPRSRFDHFYRLSTNTRRRDEGTAMIHVGDPIELLAA